MGCAGGAASEAAPAQLQHAIVAVARLDAALSEPAFQLAPESSRKGVQSADSFYLAIRKSELSSKWFFSAFLAQLYPGGPPYGAAHSLGTRVVSFRVQNGRLYVFDVDDRKRSSDTFDPDVIVDAYPIITDYRPFERLPDADEYVLFDPSAGLNRFALLGAKYAERGTRFAVDLSYVRRFRQLDDGISFEQVFTGYADQPDPVAGQFGQSDPYSASGSLGIALRKYAEGPGFEPTVFPAGEYFFRNPPVILSNQGAIEDYAYKWNIHPGMEPIKWLISERVLEVQQRPEYADYDVYGAIQAGIENWNLAFGFPVFQTELADTSQWFGDDALNYVIWDDDPSYDKAYASWRGNPNTGEIRGAIFYVSRYWLDQAIASLGPSAPPAHDHATPAPEAPQMIWEAMPGHAMAGADACPGHVDPSAASAASSDAETELSWTPAERVKRYLTNAVLHDMGHNLGLRHNLKGSLQPVSSAAMEALAGTDRLLVQEPGPYDIAALKYLYGFSAELPSQPFCTDEDMTSDPECNPGDHGADPLHDFYGPRYISALDAWLAGAAAPPSAQLNGVLQFVRAGATPEQRLSAWQLALGSLQDAVAEPSCGPRADAMFEMLIRRLYLDPVELRGKITTAPPADPQLLSPVVASLEHALSDASGAHSFQTRRTSVDILRLLQDPAALSALSDARTAVASELQSAVPELAAETQDLWDRIDRALRPYFD